MQVMTKSAPETHHTAGCNNSLHTAIDNCAATVARFVAIIFTSAYAWRCITQTLRETQREGRVERRGKQEQGCELREKGGGDQEKLKEEGVGERRGKRKGDGERREKAEKTERNPEKNVEKTTQKQRENKTNTEKEKRRRARETLRRRRMRTHR